MNNTEKFLDNGRMDEESQFGISVLTEAQLFETGWVLDRHRP